MSLWSNEGEGEVAQSCPALCDPVDCSPTKLLHPWDPPGKNTGVGYHFLLQGVFPTQGLNPGLLALEAAALTSEPPGKPKASGKGRIGIRPILHFLHLLCMPGQENQ